MDLLHAMRDLGVADPAADSTGEDTVRAAVLQEIEKATVTRRSGRTHRTRSYGRILAGGTLGMASVAAAVTVALGAATTPPAFAVTRHKDGSVSVRVNRRSGLAGANQKLAAMGAKQQVTAVGSYTYVAFPALCTNSSHGTLQVTAASTAILSASPGESTSSGNSGNSGAGTAGNSGSGNSGSGNSDAGEPVFCMALVLAKRDSPTTFTPISSPVAGGGTPGSSASGNTGNSGAGDQGNSGSGNTGDS